MMIQLADRGQERYSYNPVTKQVTFADVELSGKGRQGRRAVRQAKRGAKTQRKLTRIASRTARKQARQEGRVERTGLRQTKRTTRAKKGVARQEKGLMRVKGRQAIIDARQQRKLKSQQERDFEKQQDAMYNPHYDESSDFAPMPEGSGGAGGGYEVDSEMYEDIFNASEQFDSPEDIYIPDEQEEFYYEDEFENPEELSAPFLLPLVQGAKRLIKGGVQTGVRTAGQAVQSVDILRKENYSLKQQVERQKKNTIYVGVGSGVSGIVIGVLISKALR